MHAECFGQHPHKSTCTDAFGKPRRMETKMLLIVPDCRLVKSCSHDYSAGRCTASTLKRVY
jgi:hypothetical protein